MQESYGEGPATHTGPESCADDREVGGEVLTGVRAGQGWSFESVKPRAPTYFGAYGRQHRHHREREMVQGPAEPKNLRMYGNTSRENREVPCFPAGDGPAGRIGKSRNVRR